MTTLDLTRSTTSGGFLAGLFSAVAAWNDARQTRIALERLSDHELADIGLTRGEIDGVAQRLSR
ncbi:MAG: DUF1127 domain-containing protein [Rhodobacteraceae bacterium]|jgi:uncharacterized protein YjiS (DUF1127 family)|nr:DUF1127 domain-containing protein [Paracoccaceae bacterium]